MIDGDDLLRNKSRDEPLPLHSIYVGISKHELITLINVVL